MSNEEQRKRLIELLSKPIFPKIGVDPAEVVADYLLDNGLIVPPCKVGDTLFVLSTCMDIVSFPGDGVICPYENVCHIEDCMNYNDVLRPFPMTVDYLGIGDHRIFNIFFEETSVEYLSTDFGKTVFLTREEAEKALEGRT